MGTEKRWAPVQPKAPPRALFVVDLEKSLKRLLVLFPLSAALFPPKIASRYFAPLSILHYRSRTAQDRLQPALPYGTRSGRGWSISLLRKLACKPMTFIEHGTVNLSAISFTTVIFHTP